MCSSIKLEMDEVNKKYGEKVMISLNSAYKAHEIINAIKKYQYVSFDVFDTLVKRSVATPKDVFLNTINRFNKFSEIKFDPYIFQNDRVLAQKRAHLDAVLKGREEITIKEIYDMLPECYASFKDVIRNLEMETEIECCRPNPVLKEVYEWCLNENKKIYILSDMYLPQIVVESILKKCGYIGYEKLFLSSVLKRKKQTGTMYKFVINNLNIDCRQFVHVGDNLRFDYFQARKNGLTAVKLPTYVKRCKYTPAKGLKKSLKKIYKQYSHVASNFIDPMWDSYFQYGFEVMGPLLYGFCIWLHNEAVMQGCEKLYFLSRDGYMMQKAYCTLYGKEAITNHYLYVSRKSLSSTQRILYKSFEEILAPETLYHYWKIEELCELLNINVNEGKKLWIESGISENERLSKKELSEDPRATVFYNKVNAVVENSAKTCMQNIVHYLEQEGFNGNVGIVDVGWAGTIQRYLQKIVEIEQIEASICGFYLGLKPVTVTGTKAMSYLPKEVGAPLFCSQLVEYPFTKRVGSTLTYTADKNGKINVVLMDYEFEEEKDDHITKSMQEGMLHYVDIMRSGYGITPLDYVVAYSNLRKVTKSPRITDVKLLGQLTHVNHGRVSYLANPRKLSHYIFHPRQFKLEFSDSGWKIGFLKKLFRLKLPYNCVLYLLRKRDC